MSLQGYSSFGRSNGEVGNRDNTWQLDEEFTYAKAGHNLSIGAGVRYRRGWHLNGNSSALGALSFQPVFTAQFSRMRRANWRRSPEPGIRSPISWSACPSPECSWDCPSSNSGDLKFTPFLQDTWKLTRNLTLNYGVSWFLDTPPQPQAWARDLVHSLDPTPDCSLTPVSDRPPPGPRRRTETTLRPGLASPGIPVSVPKRWFASAQAFTTPSFRGSSLPTPCSPSPVGVGQSFTNSLTNPVPTYALGVNVFPAAPSGGLTPSYASSLPQGALVTLLNPEYADLIRESMEPLDSAQSEPEQFRRALLPGVQRASPPECGRPGTMSPDGEPLCAPSTRPWPRYGLMLFEDNAGNSSYHAMLAKYERRLERTLNLRVEYTLAKSLSDTWQAANSSSNQITVCRRMLEGPQQFRRQTSSRRERGLGVALRARPRSRRMGGSGDPRLEHHRNHRLLHRAAGPSARSQPDRQPFHHASPQSPVRRTQWPPVRATSATTAFSGSTRPALPFPPLGTSAIAAEPSSPVRASTTGMSGFRSGFPWKGGREATIPGRDVQRLESRPVPAAQRRRRGRPKLRPHLRRPATPSDPTRCETALVRGGSFPPPLRANVRPLSARTATGSGAARPGTTGPVVGHQKTCFNTVRQQFSPMRRRN